MTGTFLQAVLDALFNEDSSCVSAYLLEAEKRSGWFSQLKIVWDGFSEENQAMKM